MPEPDVEVVRGVLLRIEKLFLDPSRYAELRRVAETLKADGFEHELIYCCFASFHPRIPAEEPAVEDEYVLLLDWIASGAWSHGTGLFGTHELDSERTDRFRGLVAELSSDAS